MALPLPALTFEQTAIFTPASTSPADVLLAIQAAFAALTVNQWTTARAKGEDANNPGIRITAPSGSPISNFNAILGAPYSISSGYIKASTRDYHQTAGADTTVRGPLYLNLGPDGYVGPCGLGHGRKCVWHRKSRIRLLGVYRYLGDRYKCHHASMGRRQRRNLRDLCPLFVG